MRFEEIGKKYNLSERQKLFCFFYLQSFNARMAAIKAGYSSRSHDAPWRLMRNEKVLQAIGELKREMVEKAHLDAEDVLGMYVKIAFADILDYVKIQGSGKDTFLEVNSLEKVDGQLVEEISASARGIRLKLCDRMKALEKLEKYFDLLSDSWRRELAQKKLEMGDKRLGVQTINVITCAPRPKEDGDGGDECEAPI
ncbi:MAG: terminase small subunit [Christensenellales bacterium]